MLDISNIDTKEVDVIICLKRNGEMYIGAKDMKYKVRLWSYDILDYEEAETELNRMAGEGYELIRISMEWIPLALYQKTSQAVEKRYEVEPSWDQDECYIQMCQDAGWTKLFDLKTHLSIFVTTNKKAKPLYSDQKSRYQHAAETMQSGCRFDFTLMGYIFAMIVCYLGFAWVRDDRESRCFVITAASLLTVFMISYSVKYYYTLKYARAMSANPGYPKPGWLKWLNQVSRLAVIIVPYLGMMALWLYKFIITSPDITGIMLTLAAPVLFICGYLIRAFTKQRKPGFCIMLIGVWLLFTAPILVEHLSS